jgi:hypothetical protein
LRFGPEERKTHGGSLLCGHRYIDEVRPQASVDRNTVLGGFPFSGGPRSAYYGQSGQVRPTLAQEPGLLGRRILPSPG